jgi:hypothetical protein
MRKKRLLFCLVHADWTLKDWKNVIFTDETSVCLGQRRGAVRVWRQADELNEVSCVRRYWKGFSEFMVWGYFSYDKKGPLYIWGKETKAQKKAADEEIEVLNKEYEPLAHQEWEITTRLARMKLRNGRIPGREPTFRFTTKNGYLERDSKGGIDWYCYYKVCLLLFYIKIFY